MRKRNHIITAVLVVATAASTSMAVSAAPQAGASVTLAQSVDSAVIRTQAQPSANTPTTAAQPTGQPRQRRFWGPILGSIERAADPDPQQANCDGAKVRTWDAASRRYVYTADPACK